MSDKETIKQIANCYTNKKLSLSVLEEKPALAEESLREIQIQTGNTTLTIIIFDEYKDLDIQNPVLWLNFIIDTCQSFEEEKDFHEWRKNEGYKDTDFYQSLYQTYSELIPKIREIIGTEVRAIDYQHIEFNTDIAKALRVYKF